MKRIWAFESLPTCGTRIPNSLLMIDTPLAKNMATARHHVDLRNPTNRAVNTRAFLSLAKFVG